MHAPSSRIRRIALNEAGPGAVLRAGAVVWQGVRAACSAETYNEGSNWNSGSVLLTNDGNGSAMFAAPCLVPGDTRSRCFVLTGTSEVTGVNRDLDNIMPDEPENDITMEAEQGTGGAFGTCDGFEPEVTHAVQLFATFFTDHASYVNAILPWPGSPTPAPTTATGAQSSSLVPPTPQCPGPTRKDRRL